MSETLLTVDNLCKCYPNFALDKVSFELKKGYIMGFVGPNGAGKTTTLKLILNDIMKDSGTIKLFGLDPMRHQVAIKQRTGIVFDSLCFVKEWTMKDIDKAFKLFYNQWDSKAYYDYLERFRILPEMSVADLSRGMGEKLMLATALSHQAELLILDEPTSGLDPVSRDDLMSIFQTYIESGERSILFSTHITSDLDKIADYITCINNGKIYYTGTKDALIEQYAIVKGNINEYKGHESLFYGLRKYSTGFEAMIDVKDVPKLKFAPCIEKPTIEEIVIFMGRQEKIL